MDDLTGQSRAVDVEAFQNLIDPEETKFLRRCLPPAHFRIVQRERTLAAIEYVRNITHNAALLIRLGQLALNHPDPQLARAAQAMVERGLHVRTLAMFALLKLYTRSMVPVLPFEAHDIFRDYRSLTESAVLFTRLQRPAFAGRLSAML
ncbi:MAG: hypothetical protein ACXVZV_06035 [Terriglobales bacterium]